MIAGVTGGKALPEEIAEQIIDRTDGVPLFVEELTKAVVESGMLTEAGDHYTAAGPLPPLAIPTSLHASLLARLDRLAPVREVAQIGAALGRQFSHELLSAVAPMPPAQLDEALAQLVGAELVFRRGTPPDAEYTFKHALVQDAAYSTLLRERRQQLHARIAAALEERFPETVEAQPALLAHHCNEAGLSARAVRYWQRAGERATQRSAHVEAIAHLTKGLETCTSSGNRISRDGRFHGSPGSATVLCRVRLVSSRNRFGTNSPTSRSASGLVSVVMASAFGVPWKGAGEPPRRGLGFTGRRAPHRSTGGSPARSCP